VRHLKNTPGKKNEKKDLKHWLCIVRKKKKGGCGVDQHDGKHATKGNKKFGRASTVDPVLGCKREYWGASRSIQLEKNGPGQKGGARQATRMRSVPYPIQPTREKKSSNWNSQGILYNERNGGLHRATGEDGCIQRPAVGARQKRGPGKWVQGRA